MAFIERAVLSAVTAARPRWCWLCVNILAIPVCVCSFHLMSFEGRHLLVEDLLVVLLPRLLVVDEVVEVLAGREVNVRLHSGSACGGESCGLDLAMSIHDQLLHLMRDVTASDDKLTGLGRLACVVTSELTKFEGLLREVSSVLLLGLDTESLAASLALHAALLVRELGGLLHGDLLGLLHHGLLVGVMVLAGVVECCVDELEHTVRAMEGLAAPVVQLVLTDEASAITLQTVAGD